MLAYYIIYASERKIPLTREGSIGKQTRVAQDGYTLHTDQTEESGDSKRLSKVAS